MSDLTPLSSDQERLWLRRYLFPEWGNESPAVVWLGPMAPAAVRAACSALVRRHPALRTVYPRTDGVPAQRVLPATRFAVSLIDLSGLAEPRRRAALGRVVAAEAQRPFDLDNGPVLRVELVRLSEREHVLVSGVHHIAVDPWSIMLLGEDLMALAGTASTGQPDRLAPVSTTYLDYVAWLQRRRTGPAAEADQRFWARRLAGVTAVELPLDRPRPARLTTEVLVHAVDLPAEVSDLLRETARAAGVTTFVALLACFTALVRRWSGAEEFVVMTVPSGRVRTEFGAVVGLFTGDVAVCCDASGDPTVGELLTRVRDAVLDTFDHPEPAFNEMAAGLDPERTLTPHPLRQLGLVLHNRRPPEVDLARVDLPNPAISRGNATADIWLDVFDSGAGPMRMRLEMAEELFEVRAGRLTAERLITLTGSAMADTKQRISALPFIGPGEAELIAEWGRACGTRTQPVRSLLDRGAELAPRSAALRCGDRVVTHAQLRQRVRAVAARLVDRGVGPGTVVSVDGDDQVAVLVAALAALCAGGGVAVGEAAGAPRGARLRFARHSRRAHHIAVRHRSGGITHTALALVAQSASRALFSGGPRRLTLAPGDGLDVVAVLATLAAGGTYEPDGRPEPGMVWLADHHTPSADIAAARDAGAAVWVRFRAAGLPGWTAAAPVPATDERGTLPLGRPLGVAELRVVDDRGGPVPIGVAGDLLFAGSAGSSRPGWRTGDRVLFDSDGMLWPAPDSRFPAVGGRWVDLDAVERALLTHPEVAGAAAAVRRCRTRAGVAVTHLLCWVRPADSAALSERATREIAALVAATTAVPHTIVEAADLSSVHADALPVPELGDRRSGGLPAPRTRTETAVAQLYQEILGAVEVGRADSFFVLGGTSMQVCRLAARLTDRFGVDLPLHDLFLRPRVAQVAAAVDAELAAAGGQRSGSDLRTASTTVATAMSDRQRG
ncbi:condensation domain-containing protein [Actinokineospora guangxiensis]|uniref:Condensation domain-containing protein n=1 Tax=Actinokineospora guangxiensis TaxID=1490288 RepID=A0ABW0EQZ0_9PSEU